MDSQLWVTEKIRERRREPRAKLVSRIVVGGVDANGESFNETCDAIDLSLGGISWRMESEVRVDTLLTLDFLYPQPAAPLVVLRRKGTARVVRVDQNGDGKYAVAACFERLVSLPPDRQDQMNRRNGTAPVDPPPVAA
jgi:hypothetical protein